GKRGLSANVDRGIGSTAAHPCKERKDGAPSVQMTQTKIQMAQTKIQMAQTKISISMSRAAAFAAIAVLVCQMAAGQQSPPTNWTAEQDHQNMMDQLGIKALRPGPSGNEKDPNHANYDESKANPFPDAPDPLITNDGQKV